jgi:hypothetical protein
LDSHRLGIYEERGALGAGGEHLGRADKLGSNSPEVISKVAGCITRQEAEPFLNILQGRMIIAKAKFNSHTRKYFVWGQNLKLFYWLIGCLINTEKSYYFLHTTYFEIYIVIYCG